VAPGPPASGARRRGATPPYGVNNHPDLSGWPTQAETAGLFDEFYKVRRILYNAKRRMEQF